MGVPQNILNFTSPVLTQALKTGARGSTTTNTNYGVIGDAFFKKAQLELGMANLQADLGVKTAEIKSGLEMENARLNLSKAQMLLDYDLKKKENDVGFFEGLFGTLEGAASGAIAGSVIPGVGTVAGAIAGGAMTGIGYAAEGKKGGEAARGMLGTVSKAAVLIKGVNQEQKNKDTWAGLMKTGADIFSNMNKPGQTPEQMQQSQVDWANHLGALNTFQVNDLGMNPQQAAEGTKGYASSIAGYDVTDPKQKGAADMTRRTNEFANMEEGTITRDDYKKFWADQSVNYMKSTGKDLSQQGFDAMVESTHPGLKSLMQERGGTAPARARQEQARREYDPAQTPPTMETPSVGDLQIEPIQGRRNVQQPGNPNQQSNTIPILGAGASGPVGTNWRPPAISGGVQMDDGGAITVQDIQKQGQETVEALQKQKQPEGIKDRSTHLEGLDWLVPDTETASGNKKIDEKIAASKERTDKLIKLKEKAVTESVEGPEEIAQREQERAIRHPGVKEARQAQRADLEEKAPIIDKMPEKVLAQINRKQGLKDAVAASQHLDDIMEKIPDDLYTRFSQFVKKEGIGIKSPHVSAEILDEVAKALVDSEAEDVFSDSERDLLNEWVSESYNLAYADSLMDAGAKGVNADMVKESKNQMPGFGDDYRERSNKLRILMRGYGERINDAGESSFGNEGERLDLESKRMRNQKQAQGLSGSKSKKTQDDWWKDITGG